MARSVCQVFKYRIYVFSNTVNTYVTFAVLGTLTTRCPQLTWGVAFSACVILLYVCAPKLKPVYRSVFYRWGGETCLVPKCLFSSIADVGSGLHCLREIISSLPVTPICSMNYRKKSCAYYFHPEVSGKLNGLCECKIQAASAINRTNIFMPTIGYSGLVEFLLKVHACHRRSA